MSSFESPNWLSDEDVQRLGVKEQEIQSFKKYYYQQSFGIDRWYETLKDETFETNFLYLNEQDINALIYTHHKIRKYAFIESKPSQEKEQLDADFQTLIKRLDDALAPWKKAGVFIKLNTRSPKDVVINEIKCASSDKILKDVEAILPLVKKERNKLSNSNDNTVSANELIESFVRVTTLSMKVHSGEEAINLLILSERIYEDLSRVESFGMKDIQGVSITIRKWLDSVPNRPYAEFRGFVYKNNLNALSQYDNLTFYPQIYYQRKKIETDIYNYFNDRIRDKLTHVESYVIDFFYDENRIYVIELNPFHIGAGACLFTWRENRELFMNGPFEFRIVEKVHNVDALQGLPGYWDRMLAQIMTKYNDNLKKNRNPISPRLLIILCFVLLYTLIINWL